MPCEHIASLRNREGVVRVSLAAENLFTSTSLPCRASSSVVPLSLRCSHPCCVRPTSGDIHLCVECVHAACRHSSHLSAHCSSASHPISLSVEHGRLYCAFCDDFVYDPYLDAAVELQRRIAASFRRNFLSSPSPLDRAHNPYLNHASSASASSHALVRARSKRRRVLSVNHWTPTEAELALIDTHSIGRLRPVSSPVPPVGLYNLGNSCYMNSVLQAFLNAPPLRCYFLADSHRPSCPRARKKLDCLACALDTLVCDSHAGEVEPTDRDTSGKKSDSRASSPPAGPASVSPFLVPQRVLEIMWKYVENLASYAQHDAHEFLIATLNLLNNHCRRRSPSTTPSGSGVSPSTASGGGGGGGRGESGGSGGSADGRSASRVGNSPRGGPLSPVANLRGSGSGGFGDRAMSTYVEQSIVQNLFSGTLQSDVICRVCGNRSPTLEKFYDISLDVDNDIKPHVRRSRASSPDASGGAGLGGSGSGTHGGGSSRAPSVDRGSSSGEGRKKAGSSGASEGNGNDVAGPVGSGQVSGAATSEAGDGYATGASSPAIVDASGVEQFGEMETANSLAECLSRFTEPEMLGEAAKMYCQQCGVRQEAMKQMSIRSLPPVLCFHFKRFEQNFAKIRRSEMVKIDTPVEFPVDNLDMSPFQTSAVARKRKHGPLGSSSNRETPDDPIADAEAADFDESATTDGAGSIAGSEGDTLYDLFAVVNHTGKIDRGHYTTLVRRRGSWFKCDDDKVTAAPRVAHAIRSGEAYLVFYTQRNPNLTY